MHSTTCAAVDDATGNQAESELVFTVPATPSSMGTIIAAVRHLLEGEHWTDDDVVPVVLAVYEALANAIRHGCRGDATESVRCTVRLDPTGDLSIVVRDPGQGFDLTTVPNATAGHRPLRTRGRGLSIITQLMDAVTFVDGGREVRMRRRHRGCVAITTRRGS